MPGHEVEEDDGADEIVLPAGPDVAFTKIEWDASVRDTDGKSGADVIQEFVKRLPNAPGVYRMMNVAGDVLYVGKARSLKKRVTNYAQGRFHTSRIGRMVRETTTMEFVVTRTETEALLLEANLIKRLRPRFNVLMRDDKSFPYIMLTTDHASPGIFKHRGARSRKSEYFGPFASAGAVGRTINSLQRAFLLRTCTDSVFESRTRPCLLYQIKRCSGPCTGEIGPEDYAGLVGEARDFLSGKSQKVKAEISGAMQHAAEELDFERAAVFRDRLAALSHVQTPPGHQHAGRRRGRCVRHPSGRRADLHPGVLLQDRAELGQPRLFPEGRSGPRARRSAEFVPRPVLRRQADARVPSCCRAPSRSRNCWPRRFAPRPAARSRSACRSAAKRRT